MTSKNKKPEMTTIAGCLIGLSHVLVNFTQSVEEGIVINSKVYFWGLLKCGDLCPSVVLV